MKRTIRPLWALIFGAVCTLLAPLSHATRISAQENTRKPAASAVAQGHRKAGKTPDPSEKFDLETMSSMGRLAQLAATGRLRDGQSKAKDNNKLVGRAVVGDQPVFKLQADDDGVDRDNADGPSGGQAQPSIAVDSTGQHIVIGLNDTRGFDLNPIAISGYMYSDDGGKTFTDGGQLPPGPSIDFIGSTTYPQIFGDPEVKYVGGSTFIYVSIMVKKLGTSSTTQTLCFHKSTDFGHTWSGPFEIPAATNPNGLLNGESVDAADKPFADVDPDSGRLLVSWSNFTPFALGGVEISTTFSDNILNSTPTWSPRIVVAATEVDGQSSIPRFAGNGSPNVYLAWRRFSGPEQDNVGFARSTDNGATWSTPVNVAADFFMVDQVLGDDRVNSAPGMAVDNSSGPGKGTLYLVYSNN